MLNIIAHGAEIHESAVQSTVHSLAWYVQLPLSIFIAAGFFALIQLVVKKKSSALLIMSLILFVAAFSLYIVATLVSALAVTASTLILLFVILFGASQDEVKTAPKVKVAPKKK